MERTPSAGLLPCYLKLYDDVRPECRDPLDKFAGRIAAALRERGLAVSLAPTCRLEEEFRAAVARMEDDGVDCIFTLHLAYSPSLQAADVLCATDLPIVMLDTTMDVEFGLDVKPDRIMYNHGVHGVMDLASVLRRRGRAFEIVAGRWDDALTLDRAAGLARAAAGARALRGSRLLRVGEAFAGMGDFAVDEALLADRFGMDVRQVGIEALDEAVQSVSEDVVSAELAADRARFAYELPEEVHVRSVRVGLGLRRLLEDGAYDGMSVNFEIFDRPDRPSDTVPFLEISKAMARGIGYAGEGDVLTAAMVGALARAFGAVTFTEIFCADWAGEALFLSHMGEISPAVAADTPRVIEKPFPYGGALNPAVLTCAVKPGPATFVNLAPGPADSFGLIVVPVDVLAENDSVRPAMRNTVRAWMRPQMPVARFLEAYSRAGGTHHSALVLGDRADEIVSLARMAGMDALLLEERGENLL